MREKYLYNPYGVRLNLISKNSSSDLNWLLIPGGAGMDSSYLSSLSSALNLPGQIWHVDLPGNGSNGDPDTQYDFDSWPEIFLNTVKGIINPIVIGHSFGAMLSLMIPSLEQYLKGFVILNAAPKAWAGAREEQVANSQLPCIRDSYETYIKEPTLANFKLLTVKAVPHIFGPTVLKRAEDMIRQLPYNHHAYRWWIQTALDSYNATWVPQKTPTLVLCSEFDYVTPAYMFESDERFQRENISIKIIPNTYHISWFENPEIIAKEIHSFAGNLLK